MKKPRQRKHQQRKKTKAESNRRETEKRIASRAKFIRDSEYRDRMRLANDSLVAGILPLLMPKWIFK